MLKLLTQQNTGHGGTMQRHTHKGCATETQPGQSSEWTLRPLGVSLLERGEELALIKQAVAVLRRGHGGVLVIQGAAGIGKSALLGALCEQAVGQGVQTLTASASELERDFGFGVVRQLLERRVVHAGEQEQAELLDGAARLAGSVLGLGGSVGDPLAALHGLYWLLANLAVDAPVVLAVDDLHWADEPSLRWLIYLCHRLEGLPVLVAASTHAPRPRHSALLAELLTVSGAQILCPRPLSEPAVAQLICEGLGAQPDPAFVSTCVKLTEGNPFVLRELIFDLARDNVTPDAAQVAVVVERVPGQVEWAVLARLKRLNHAAERLVRAVAVLGDGSGLRLAAALAELDIDTAAEAADALATAELFAEGRPLRFVHPLVRTAVYEQIPSGARSQAHARAARLLIRESAEPEQVSVHLLACEPMNDPEAVGALRAAAAAASVRGAPEIAVTYLRRALTEPPPKPDHAAVLGELGNAERIARDPTAVVHLEQAWQATTEVVTRARLADKLANVLYYAADLARASAVLRAGLANLSDQDSDLAVRMHADKASMELLSVRPTEAHEVTLKHLRELVTRSSPVCRWGQLALAGVLALRGESCDEVAGLVERGLDDGRFLAEETCEALPATLAAWALTFTDELNRANALAEAMLADARARGSVVGFLVATARRGMIALRRGALTEAEADTRTALQLATEHNLIIAVPFQVCSLSLTLLERGALDQAAAVVEGVTLTPARMEAVTGLALLEARGRVHLARGQRTQAIADLRHCGQLADHAGLRNPNFLAWRSALALALAPEHPHEAWELAQTELRLARRVDTPRAIGIALRVCGLLVDAQERIELLEQSVDVLESSPARLELAYSLTELGAALRRRGARTSARQPLRQALDLATRCGATPLAERAREEALAAGARPRRSWTSGVHALTPSELRVARLAAQGMSNRDIAQALFITAKTVSDHLTSAYRKLNIHGRDELTTAMTERE